MVGPAQVFAAIALSVLGGFAVATLDDPIVLAALLVGALFILVGMVAPTLFLSVLLLSRPLLDGIVGSSVGDVPSANAAGAVGVVLVGVAAVVISGTPRFVNPRMTLALVGILAVSTLAATQALLEFGGAIGVEPLAELARVSALVAIYLLAGKLFGDDTGVRRLYQIIIASAAVPILVGLYELAVGVEPVPGYDVGRISGTFGGPIPFSIFLAAIALILTQLPRDILDNRLRLLLLAMSLVTLVATYSRAGWLIFLVGFVLLQWHRHKVTLALAAFATALLVLAIPNVQQRVLPEGSASPDRTAPESSFDWRLANWGGLLESYGERPLTGWGLRTTGHVNTRAPVNAKVGGGYDAHNTGVRALVEGGPLLLAAYVGMFAILLVSLRRIVSDEAWPLQPLARVLFVVWIGIGLVAVAADDPFEATATMYALLALTGAVHAAHGAWIAKRDDVVPAPGSEAQQP